ncbi:MAG TPA: hypothetical protein PLU22_13195 [Polyangiaceae bacterium]|nr:hypothetical protein [Polyangiaceae bacterium]
MTGAFVPNRPDPAARATGLRRRRAATRGAAIAGALTLLLAIACAAPPRPRILTQVDAVRTSPAASTAKELAPQAFLAAEQLRSRSRAAADAGDLPAAQVLGEHAVAAYEHAFVLARLASAERRLAQARLEVDRARRELAAIDEQQRRVSAEADAIELRAQVLRDLEPLAQSGTAAPERERARRQAAQSLVLQARLTCTAARLLAPEADGLAGALEELSGIERRLASAAEPAPIDDALRARSRCLSLLTFARRATPLGSADPSAADALLTAISEGGRHLVFRDDRGVVVLLRDLFDTKNELTATAAADLAALARLARDHAAFPILVVVHGPVAPARQAGLRAERLAEALRQGGAPRVETTLAGDALPLIDPGRTGAAERNSRYEIVFVAPVP